MKSEHHPTLLLRHVQKRIAGEYDGINRMPIARVAVLEALRLKGALNQDSLCQASGTDRSTLSSMLPHLFMQGYVEPHPVPNDRREKWVKLTKAGAEALKSAKKNLREAEDRAFNNIPEHTRITMIKALHKVIGNQ